MSDSRFEVANGQPADRRTITEALPRREIESLENEIRSLGRRIDETRQTGVDGSALAGIERALSEIYSALRTLTPAEQFAGFDEAIRNLGGKVDSIVRSSHDPSTIRQLEDAIAALKSIASNVASNEALNELAGHLQALSAKVDQLAHASGNSDILSALEQRIAVLTTALEQRDRPAASDTGYFDNAVRAISDRLDHLQIGNDSASSLNHVEQRIHHLLERLESTETRGNNFSRVEAGLADILRHLEQQRVSAVAAEQAIPAAARRWTAFLSKPSSVSCPTSASASRKPIDTPSDRSRPFTTRSAMWSIVSHRSKLICARHGPHLRHAKRHVSLRCPTHALTRSSHRSLALPRLSHVPNCRTLLPRRLRLSALQSHRRCRRACPRLPMSPFRARLTSSSPRLRRKPPDPLLRRAIRSIRRCRRTIRWSLAPSCSRTALARPPSALQPPRSAQRNIIGIPRAGQSDEFHSGCAARRTSCSSSSSRNAGCETQSRHRAE